MVSFPGATSSTTLDYRDPERAFAFAFRVASHCTCSAMHTPAHNTKATTLISY